MRPGHIKCTIKQNFSREIFYRRHRLKDVYKRQLHGEGALQSAVILDKTTGTEKEIPVDGIFVNIGVIPNTSLFKGQLDMDENGRIIAGEDCKTNLPGVFAAGDVRIKAIRQLTTAAADGTTAALLAEQYLVKLKES